MRSIGRTLFVSTLILFLAIHACLAWSGPQHWFINRSAARHVPDEMLAWRAYASVLARPGSYPDSWRVADPQEAPRHYFEPDVLPPGMEIEDIRPDLNDFFANLPISQDTLGIAPWTIQDLFTKMSDAMRTNDWVWAARCAAAMGHYVGDLHMPLHATQNFNGQLTRQRGIHTRVESEMTRTYFAPHMATVTEGIFIEDPFTASLHWAWESYEDSFEILRTDLIAQQFSRGRVDTEDYFTKMWELTGELLSDRIGLAASRLSGLWYSAWVNAGKPAIPPPPETLPSRSVFSGVDIKIEPIGLSGQKEQFDLIMKVIGGGLALLILFSSLARRKRKTQKSD